MLLAVSLLVRTLMALLVVDDAGVPAVAGRHAEAAVVRVERRVQVFLLGRREAKQFHPLQFNPFGERTVNGPVSASQSRFRH